MGNSFWYSCLVLSILLFNMGCETVTGDGCSGTLDAVSDMVSPACPSTYDDVDAWLNICDGGVETSAGSCDRFLLAGVSFGTHGHTCYYDESSRALVSIRIFDDIASFCDRTDAQMIGGADPGYCTEVSVPQTSDGNCSGQIVPRI